MVAYRIDTFGGMVPAVADELLDGKASVLSKNTWLYRGNLVGLPTPVLLHTLVNPNATKVYRIPESYGRSDYLFNSIWMEFVNTDTDVVRAPVFGDVHDRYYWASPTPPPMYNTLERIKLGKKAWILGVPPPGEALEISVTGGSTRLADVRLATTAPGVLATDYITGATLDGSVLEAGDRILIKDQAGANAKDNGVRVVGAGVPARASDMNISTEFVGHYVKVLEGDANAGTSWECINTSPPTVDTTAINFKEISELPVTATRSYVYTWVTAYGEESAPSPPAIETGPQDGIWELTDLAVPDLLDQGESVAPVPDDARRYITKTRIYRTVTSLNGVATFFLVVEQDCNLTSFSDDISDNEVTQNSLLQSFSWTPPPELKGLTAMWNGMIAGFMANEVWFCEPYRPHAWPASYVITVEYPIVGLGVSNQTLVICTAGNPVTVNGAMPASLSTAKIAKFEPCTSRGSILSSPEGVLFTSPNGLISCGNSGAINVTKDVLTRDKWYEHVGEARLRAAWLGEAYYAFGGTTPGVFQTANPPAFADPSNDPTMAESWVQQLDYTGALNGILVDRPPIAFNVLTSEAPVHNVQNDAWSGELLIVRDGVVQWLDLRKKPDATIEPCVWKSMRYQTPDKKNLGAMKVYFSITSNLPALNPIRNVELVQTLADDQWGLCRIYADDRLVLTRELRQSGELWKLPSGFLADFWQYEIETRLEVLNVQIASSAKELVTT